jgi:hypothetical protein
MLRKRSACRQKLTLSGSFKGKHVPKTPHWPSKLHFGSDKESDKCYKNTVPGDKKYAFEGGS